MAAATSGGEGEESRFVFFLKELGKRLINVSVDRDF